MDYNVSSLYQSYGKLKKRFSQINEVANLPLFNIGNFKL